MFGLLIRRAAGYDPIPSNPIIERQNGTEREDHGKQHRTRADPEWQPHPVPGIRMKVLAMNAERGYATLVLDVAPGTRFPPHHHAGAEECYVISGSLFTCGRRLGPGDFVHADGDTDHDELYTEEGCQVLLVVPPDDYV